MSSAPLLTVVLPCYNPVDDWVENLILHFSKIKNEIPNTKLIVVNDGSTKNFSAQSVEKLLSVFPETTIIENKINQGKGFTLREGVRRSKSELVIYTDIDFPYTHESFLKIYAALKNENADVVIGIRGEKYYEHLPKTRVRISKMFRRCIIFFLRIPTDDTQCGLKGFNQKGKEIFLQTTINRFLFDLEFILLASQKKLNIKSIEAELGPGIQLSKVNWKILLQEAVNFLKIF